MRHGGRILVDHLKAQGVTRVFSIPGESFLAVLDGLYDSGIVNVVCRHEGGATMMAEAHGKLTGRPGVAFVTRGPGATNGASGIHVARQDSTPMIVFVGQIARGHRDREAFQEVDYRAVFGPLAKWVAEVDDVARLPEYVNRAFHVAHVGSPRSRRAGPARGHAVRTCRHPRPAAHRAVRAGRRCRRAGQRVRARLSASLPPADRRGRPGLDAPARRATSAPSPRLRACPSP